MRIYQLVNFHHEDSREDPYHYASRPSDLFLTYWEAVRFARSDYHRTLDEYRDLADEKNPFDEPDEKFKMVKILKDRWAFTSIATGVTYIIYTSHTKEALIP